MASFGAGFGEALGKNVLAEREAAVREKELGLKEKKLGLEASALDAEINAKRQTAMQGMFEASVKRMDGFFNAVKELGPQFKAGSALDKAIDQEKLIMATIAGKVGIDPNVAEALATKVRSAAQIPAKPVALGQGQSLVNPATGETVTSVPAGPQSPQGKLLADRELFVGQFGEGSEQVKALDESLVAASGGASVSEQNTLRSQFLQQSTDFVKIRDAFGKIAVASQNPSAAGDLVLVFNFMKILDPISVVRENEQATVQNAAGVPDRVRNLWNRVFSGERLSPDQRQDIINQSENLFKSQLKNQELLEKNFEGVAKGFKADPKQVVIDMIGEFRDQKGEKKKDAKPKKALKFDAQGNPI